jgi:hypothetical protein
LRSSAIRIPDAGRAGAIMLSKVGNLRVGQIYVRPISNRDPHFCRNGVYRIPAISLVEWCEHYDSEYLLCYLPLEATFGVFDADHARVTTFARANWLDILKDPASYLNSLWQKEPAVECSCEQWEWWLKYIFFEDEVD